MRTAIVILLLLGCSPRLWAQHPDFPLEWNEGYLIVGIDVRNIFWTSFSIDGGGTFGDAHRFTRKTLQTELVYEIIRLPAGSYHWDRLGLLNTSYFRFGEDEYPMTVEAGQINYGGVFVGRRSGNDRATFKVINRATAAILHLETCCLNILERYPLRSGLINKDPFLDYYSSHKLYHEIPVDLRNDSKMETGENSSEEPEAAIESLIARDFFRRNRYAGPELSPNGKLVAAFEDVNEVRHLILLNPISEYKRGIIAEDDALVLEDVRWIDNDDLLITYRVRDVERMAHAKVLFEDGLPVDARLSLLGEHWYVVDPLPEMEDKAAIVVYKNGLPNLHTIDINDSTSKILGSRDRKFQKKMKSTFKWLLSRNGRVRAAVGLDDDKLTQTLWYRTSKSNKWYAIWVGDPGVTIAPVLAADDDRTLTVISNEFTENTILTTYDRVSGTYGETVFEVEGSDIESVELDSAKTRIIRVATTQEGVIRHHYMGDAKAQYPQLLDYDTYGSEPYIIGQSNDGQQVLVQTSTSDDPGTYYLLDVNDNVAYEIGELRPWLTKFRLGSSRVVTANTSDGLEIEAFLTVPDPEAYPKPPLIVMPHGGPIGVQDRQHFDPMVQMLATLGYAILRTNYRGSGGYGKSFEEGGEGQWGRLIERDIEASLDAVLALNIVDAEKVCIFGASYGGYSALISAIQSPERYKCAASYAGVTDMPLMFHAFRVNRSNLIRSFLERIVGDPESELDSMIHYSPVFNADKIEVPVLIVHGEQDDTVDMEHYERMVMMLNRFGKDVEYYTLDREGHGFVYLDSAVSFFSILDQFFRRAMDLPESSVAKVVHENVVWPGIDVENPAPSASRSE